MSKTFRTANSAIMAAMCLAAVLSFAPTPAKAGSCLCSDRPSVPAVEANSQQECDTMCGGAGKGQFTASSSPSGTPSTSTPPKTLDNPLEICKGAVGAQCVQKVIGNIIRAALGIVGSIALLMMIWGGFLWLTSMGNSDRVEKGKSTLIWATLGLVVIFGAYALTSFIINSISK